MALHFVRRVVSMWALATAAVVVLGALQIAAGEEHRVLIQTSDQVYNITVAHDGTTSAGTLDLPANSSYVARRAAANEPEQVHVLYISPASVEVVYVTGVESMGPGAVSSSPELATSVVKYSTAATGPFQTASGDSSTYVQQYYFPPDVDVPYRSPRIHRVLLDNLKPNTTYFYIPGDAPSTKPYSFTTLPAQGPSGFPVRVGFIGDVGLTTDSLRTLQILEQNKTDLVVILGDLVYADNYHSNGTMKLSYQVKHGVFDNSSGTDPTVKERIGTHQPKWDQWGRLTEPLLSTIPTLTIVGNHELEPQGEAKYWDPDSGQLAAYAARYGGPSNYSDSGTVQYWATEFGGVKIFGLSSYIDYEEGSEQYDWFVQALDRVDREQTPWLIITLHAPPYSSYQDHYMENDCFRQIYEPLWYDAGADLVFSGHVHAYERSRPMYNFRSDPCGPVYIVVGDAGNVEMLAKTFTDGNNCPSPDYKGPPYQPRICNITIPPYGYCPNLQPDWSVKRIPVFGSGVLELYNATTARWTFTPNEGGATRSDEVVFTRNPDKCPIVPLGAAAAKSA